MSTYSVRDSEVDALHNAKCYLRFALESAEEQFREDSQLVKNLRTSLKSLEPVSRRLMDIKDEIMQTRYEAAKAVAKENDLYSTWSMYEIEDLESDSGIPIGSKITSWYSEKNITTEVEGKTWLDVWKATDRLIKQSKEDHGNHVFVEGFKKVGNKQYEVILGS